MTFIMMDAYRYCPPAASSFGTTYSTNSESPTKTDTTTRGLLVTFGTSPAGGADNLRGFTKAKASSTNYDIIVRLRHTTTGFHGAMSGIGVTDGTKWVTWQFANSLTGNTFDGHRALRCDRWNSNSSFGSARLETGILGADMEWLRIGVVSGDPKDFYVSENGTDWIKLLSESQTGFLTYTQVGITQYVTRAIGTFPVSGTQHMESSFLYFSDPDIVPPV